MEEAAKLVEEMIGQEPWSKKPWARMALAVAASAIRRGRHLTEEEKTENLAKSFEEAGDFNTAKKIRAGIPLPHGHPLPFKGASK